MNRRVLYVGWGDKGGTSLQRRDALVANGCEVLVVDQRPPENIGRLQGLAHRLRRRITGFWDWAGANEAILSHARAAGFDLVWIDKGTIIEPETLRQLKRKLPTCWIVGYSPDDMRNPGNGTRQFLGCLPHYDLFFTTKSYQVEELRQAGCPRVHFVINAYDPATHRPMPLTDDQRSELGGPVGFIGGFEPDRAASMSFLAENGIPIRVWGMNWERYSAPRGMRVEQRSLWADDYARAICAFDINLAFLRKVNRDLQTTRTMEIPACGAFMLAERTDEHRSLFEEGVEAEYFSSDREMLDKVRHFLAHPDERAEIAAAGLRRCLKSGYGNPQRIASMLEMIDQARAERTATDDVGVIRNA